MKTGIRNGRYWVKPDEFNHTEMCSWCFKKLGHPDDLFLGTVGQWTINAKKGIFFFSIKEHRDAFVKDWK
jgi:hypothetical protein